jgi:hypothetical protein
MRLKLLLLFLASSTQLFAKSTCGDSLKKDNIARRVVQVGGAALGLWAGGAFLYEEDHDEFKSGYDYERIETIRRKKMMEESSKDFLVKDQRRKD